MWFDPEKVTKVVQFEKTVDIKLSLSEEILLPELCLNLADPRIVYGSDVYNKQITPQWLRVIDGRALQAGGIPHGNGFFGPFYSDQCLMLGPRVTCPDPNVVTLLECQKYCIQLETPDGKPGCAAVMYSQSMRQCKIASFLYIGSTISETTNYEETKNRLFGTYFRTALGRFWEVESPYTPDEKHPLHLKFDVSKDPRTKLSLKYHPHTAFNLQDHDNPLYADGKTIPTQYEWTEASGTMRMGFLKLSEEEILEHREAMSGDVQEKANIEGATSPNKHFKILMQPFVSALKNPWELIIELDGTSGKESERPYFRGSIIVSLYN